jgi:quercetin dioxygenase-like cupin family protein
MERARVAWREDGEAAMKLITLALVMGIALSAEPAFAGNAEIFDFKSEAAKTDKEAGAASRYLIRRPEYTVSVLVVREEIPSHQHDDGIHVLYVVSGQGTVTIEGKPVALKPGLVVHIPQGVVHSLKARGGPLRMVDFVQHAHDPSQAAQPR